MNQISYFWKIETTYAHKCLSSAYAHTCASSTYAHAYAHTCLSSTYAYTGMRMHARVLETLKGKFFYVKIGF